MQEESPILVMCHQIASHPIEHERNHLIETFHDASTTQEKPRAHERKKNLRKRQAVSGPCMVDAASPMQERCLKL